MVLFYNMFITSTIEGTILNKIKSGYYKNNSFAVDLGFGIVGLITLDSYGETHPGDKLMCRIVSFSTKKLGIILARENSGETGSSNEKNYQQNTETFTEGEQHTIRITEIKDLFTQDHGSFSKNLQFNTLVVFIAVIIFFTNFFNNNYGFVIILIVFAIYVANTYVSIQNDKTNDFNSVTMVKLQSLQSKVYDHIRNKIRMSQNNKELSLKQVFVLK